MANDLVYDGATYAIKQDGATVGYNSRIERWNASGDGETPQVSQDRAVDELRKLLKKKEGKTGESLPENINGNPKISDFKGIIKLEEVLK